ncbi:MAG: hypothetical protein ISQ38_01585 [Alphaproteobacteria bacterium]|jgi:hypothetical protein|nr:hypothetical protein [Alphaproteobacteria bacterium]|tara:strand:- start:1485 stop:1883 length:399 start_codon:yes stop_codon:yes gene_type:complete
MKKTSNFLLLLNIFFLLYYSFQLLVYTDEFALKNLGFFNHAVAGLSEIIGIIFLALSISIIYVWKNKINGQLPLFLSILLIQVLIFFNFLRYIYTDSPGETTIESIILNAFIFLIGGLNNCFFILINFRKLK